MNVRVCAVSNELLVSVVNTDEQNPNIEETLLPAEAEDTLLKVDETWSFVFEQWQKR